MKKLICIICVLLCCLACSNEKAKEKTIVGNYTPYFTFPEVLNGNVMEITETSYLPLVKEGQIEVGEPLTIAARDSISWTNDFKVTFNPQGFAKESFTMGDNGEILYSWEINSDENYYTSAKRIVKDKVVHKETITKTDDGIFKIETFDPETDTLRSSLLITLNADKLFDNFRIRNFQGEPTYTYNYKYDGTGQLTGYTVSRADTLRGGMNFTHNPEGFMDKQEIFNANNETQSTTVYKYEYDTAGNWIKCVAYKDQEPIMVSLREYKYY